MQASRWQDGKNLIEGLREAHKSQLARIVGTQDRAVGQARAAPLLCGAARSGWQLVRRASRGLAGDSRPHITCDGVKPVTSLVGGSFASNPSDQILNSKVRLADDLGCFMMSTRMSSVFRGWDRARIDEQSVYVEPALTKRAPLPHEPRRSNVRVPCGSSSGPVRGGIAAVRFGVPAFAHVAPAFSILSCAGSIARPSGHTVGYTVGGSCCSW